MAEVSDFWIKLNYWFLTYRKDLTRWWVLLIAAFDVFLIVFVITNGVMAAVTFGKNQEYVTAIAQNRIMTVDAQKRNTPQALKVESVTSVASGDNQITVVILKNPNAFWSASSVPVTLSGSKEQKVTFLLPNEQRILLLSGQGSASSTTLGDITWERTPANLLPKVSIVFGEPKHSQIVVQSSGSNKVVSSVSTTIKNASLYSITSLRGVVTVYSGAVIVAANQFFVDNLKPKEQREISVQFPSALPAFSSINFSSEVNVLDPNVLQL